MPRMEGLALGVAAGLSLTLRALALFRYRFNSDEPQHLHLAWAWSEGLLPYRDVFDNHMPVFHLATAPALAFLGERADILLWMRGLMLPLFALVLICTWRAGRRVGTAFSEACPDTAGLWAAVLLSLFPPFFLKSLEYRNDNLWNALWMVALLLMLRGVTTTRRAFLAGLLGGLMLVVSIKTLGLALAAAAAMLILRRISLRDAIFASAGFLVFPIAVGTFFAAKGAWAEFVYCNFQFNAGPTMTRPGWWMQALLFPIAVAATTVIVRRSGRRESPELLLFALSLLFVAAVLSFWALVSPRDLLPIMPILVILGVARLQSSGVRLPVFVGLVLLFSGSLYYYADRFENRTDEHITMMNQVLGLTRPGEPLMDLKGETIYRRRPWYHVFETVTRSLMQRGLIADTVPEAMIAARCYVSQAEGPMYPPRTNQFVHDYYIDLGRLRAAGQWLTAGGTFAIGVPGPYVVLNEKGVAAGLLDGSTHSGSRTLSAGTHTFSSPHSGERLAVLWAPAFERGYSPFHLRDREF